MNVLLVENHRVFAETVMRMFLSKHQVTLVGADATCAKTDIARIHEVVEGVLRGRNDR